MTSHRILRSEGPSPARARIALLLLVGLALGVATWSACADDATTVNNFIGVTDAAPPRLGASARVDGGA